MNKVQLIGRVTKDIEIRYTQNQKAFARFTLAVNRPKKDEADFISCTAWGKTAEIMEKYVHKGDRVGITGRIQTSTYEKDGQRLYKTEVIVEELEFLENRQRNKDANGFEPVPEMDKPPFISGDDNDEELPF